MNAEGRRSGEERRPWTIFGVVPGSGAGGDLVGARADRGLAVGGLVLVDDTLAGGLVEGASRGLRQIRGRGGVAGVGGLAELADRGLQSRPHRLVAHACGLVGAVALDLRLDIRHESAFAFVSSVIGSGV